MFDEKIEELNARNATLPRQEYDKRVYTVDEVQDILGIGRNATYDLIRRNLFRSVRFRSLLVENPSQLPRPVGQM